MNDTRHFVLKIYETIPSGIQTDYLNTQIVFGVQKNEYQILILLFGPTIQIVIEYLIIRHTLKEGSQDKR